jgi:transcriptional regulator with XRE-family HTH domain
MSQVELPAVARRRVRLALRSARESKQMTQTDIAKAMDWSLSKVMRIEKGEVNVSPSDLKLLLQHLDVKDPVQVGQLLDDAKLSRQQRWSIDPADREHLTPAMLELYQFEAKATTASYFAGQLIPGNLQTRAYAEALFRQVSTVGPATVAARVNSRLRRTRELYREPPLVFRVLLDQSALLRPVGSYEIMVEQFNHLVVLLDETHLDIRIVPFSAGPVLGAYYGPFVIYDLAGDTSALLYRETFNADTIVRSPVEIAQHRASFEQMWVCAGDSEVSRAMIIRQVERFRAGGV